MMILTNNLLETFSIRLISRRNTIAAAAARKGGSFKQGEKMNIKSKVFVGLFITIVSVFAIVAINSQTGFWTGDAKSYILQQKKSSIDSIKSQIEKFVREDLGDIDYKLREETDVEISENLFWNHSGGHSLQTSIYSDSGITSARIATDENDQVVRFAVIMPGMGDRKTVVGDRDWLEMDFEFNTELTK